VTGARPLDSAAQNRLDARIRRAKRLVLYTRESHRSFERRLRLLMRLVKERENALR
jgi:hypothetical protein